MTEQADLSIAPSELALPLTPAQCFAGTTSCTYRTWQAVFVLASGELSLRFLVQADF